MLVLPCQAREKGLLLDRQCVTYKRQAAWSPFPRPAGSEGGVGGVSHDSRRRAGTDTAGRLGGHRTAFPTPPSQAVSSGADSAPLFQQHPLLLKLEVAVFRPSKTLLYSVAPGLSKIGGLAGLWRFPTPT